MASSLKVSQLIGLTTLTDEDLFLVADVETSTSKKVKFSDLNTSLNINYLSGFTAYQSTVSTNLATETSLRETAINALTQLIDDMEDRNLQAGLSTGYLYVENLQGG